MRSFVYRFESVKNGVAFRQTRMVKSNCMIEAVLNAKTNLMEEFGGSDVSIIFVRELI